LAESIERFIEISFGSSPTPSPPSPVSKLDRRKNRKTEKERQLVAGREEGGGGGAKSYDGVEAWTSINLSYSLVVDFLKTLIAAWIKYKLLIFQRHYRYVNWKK
jgi:hypothetical protein